MLNPITTIIFYITEMLISYTFFSGIAKRKTSIFSILLTGIIIFNLGTIINLLFSDNIIINTTVGLVLNLVFAALCFNVNFKENVFFSFVLTALSGMTEIISIFSFSAISGESLQSYNDSFMTFMIEYPISKMLYLIGVMCILKVMGRNKNEAVTDIQVAFFIYPVSVVCCVYIFWIVALTGGTAADIKFYLVIAAVLLSAATVVLFVTWTHHLEVETEQLKDQSGQLRSDSEKTHYEIIEKQNKEMMAYAHDMKKHLSVIKEINQNSILDTYIDHLMDRLKMYSRISYSGNIMLDAVLEKYSYRAGINNVNFTYEVRTCNLIGVDDTDLIAIMNNVLDNAFNAAEKSQRKKVLFDTTTRNNYSVIIVTNSCDIPPVTYRGELVTTEKNRRLHGAGLKNVKNVLKAYKGDMRWKYEEEYKEFTIVMYLREKKRTPEEIKAHKPPKWDDD